MYDHWRIKNPSEADRRRRNTDTCLGCLLVSGLSMLAIGSLTLVVLYSLWPLV